MKKMLSLLAALMLCLCCVASAEETAVAINLVYQPVAESGLMMAVPETWTMYLGEELQMPEMYCGFFNEGATEYVQVMYADLGAQYDLAGLLAMVQGEAADAVAVQSEFYSFVYAAVPEANKILAYLLLEDAQTVMVFTFSPVKLADVVEAMIATIQPLAVE